MALSAGTSPYRIAVPDEDLARLKAKLDLVSLPDELDDSGWDYGAPLADVRRLVEHWKNGYDWRKAEKSLNETMPQYTMDVEVEGFDSLNVHFVHKTGERVNAIPLLFIHGWPGSFIEVNKVLPLLTSSDVDAPSFHVVAPSLPGYGFSEGAKKPGFSITQYAELCHKVMLKLGYPEYVAQGGDWGSLISRRIAEIYGGKHTKAYHTNMPLGTKPRLLTNPLLYLDHCTDYSAGRQLDRSQWYADEGSGYMKQQSTKPQTLGYGLQDSPVGLLAWIYEKLVDWTDEYPWTDDEVLTWISIYWFSRAGPTAASRIYREALKAGDLSFSLSPKNRASIPYGASFFPKELMRQPISWIKASANLVFTSDSHDRGGHFAAYEVPEMLVADLRKMFGRGGPAFGVVGGKNGYDG